MQIHTILDQIDLGAMALPEFQRGYVWNRDQVRGLMDSLYRKHPVGSLLVWVTKTDSAEIRGNRAISQNQWRHLSTRTVCTRNWDDPETARCESDLCRRSEGTGRCTHRHWCLPDV
jgi:hypothetical protein